MNVLENLLVTLMEECSEVAKAASKILRAGPDSTINGTRPTTNLQELQAELDDLQGVLMELRANGLDVVVRNPAAVVKKREKLRYFIGVSRQLGFVQGPLAAGETESFQALKHTYADVTFNLDGKPLVGVADAPFAHLAIADPELERRRATLDPSLLRSAKDFAEQYQCTPKPTVELVIDTLLNETNYSREYLQELALKDLLGVLRLYPKHRDLYRSLRSHINSLPETNEWLRHDGGPCPVHHEEVEVYTRSQYQVNTQDFAGVTPLRGMPERFNWNWGAPGKNVYPNDVLQWRKV